MNTLSEPPSRRSFLVFPHDFSGLPAVLRSHSSGCYSPGRTSLAFAAPYCAQSVPPRLQSLHTGAGLRLAV